MSKVFNILKGILFTFPLLAIIVGAIVFIEIVKTIVFILIAIILGSIVLGCVCTLFIYGIDCFLKLKDKD